MTNQDAEVMEILAATKKLAQRYRMLTGKPLGIAGEVAEFEAARLLGLQLVEARQAGYDATRLENGIAKKLQIKGRCIPPGATKGQRLGSIDIRKEFDGVLLVLMDEFYDATAIYEADRDQVVAAIIKPGAKARNERGALSVGSFISMARQVWPSQRSGKI